MFSMSSDRRARVLVWGVCMKVSNCACVEWHIKSKLPGIAMPSCPWGSSVSAMVVSYCVMRQLAVIRRRAVPIPIGRSLSKLAGSLWRAMTY
jgi:hypothetical protein